MKNSKKRVLLLLVILLLALAAGALVYAAPLFTMTPQPTGPIGGGMLALRVGNNSIYLLPCEGGYIAVDAAASTGRVEAGLAELGIDAGEIRHVLLTHTDSDHVAALALFTDAIVYMGEAEGQMLDGSTKRNLVQYNSLPAGAAERLQIVSDGEMLLLGGVAVECIAAPGHTPGSMAFLVAEGLFTGDAMKIANSAASVHPFTMDADGAVASIQVLLAQPFETVLTAHYGVWQSEQLVWP